MFFVPLQQPPAIVQEAPASPSRPMAMDCGPPKSAMVEKKIELKHLGRLLYGAMVVIEGTPYEYDTERSRVLRFERLGKGLLGLKISGPLPNPQFAPMTAFWMDSGAIKSGPNVVQRNYSAGWGY
ncbi:MAG: hypothetical protein FWG12_06135 [Holophagaceae bacterium]|nr:hypothetical protein [Holophagaceae bacterium]